VTSLDLSWNDLGRLTGAELAVAFASLPVTVNSLDLSQNDLERLTGAELAQVFAAIPATVTGLDLRNYNFGHITGKEFGLVGIPLVMAPFIPISTLLILGMISPGAASLLFLGGAIFIELKLGKGQYDLEGYLVQDKRKLIIDLLLETGKNIQLDELLATELREARRAKRIQYGTFFDEAKSGLPPELVNEIFDFTYSKSPSR
jgi:hypothetical protein